MTAQTQSELEVGTGKSVDGRKDADGTPAVIKVKPLRDALADLLNLKGKADTAKDRLNDAVKAVAEKTGLLSSVVRKLVNAKSGDKFDEEKRKVDQASLIFESFDDDDFRKMDVGNGKPRQPKLAAADAAKVQTDNLIQPDANEAGGIKAPAVDPMKGTDLEAGKQDGAKTLANAAISAAAMKGKH